MKAIRDLGELRAELERVGTGSTIGLVPTMGAFHEGHLSLIRAARVECDVVLVSLFVNPAQFDSPRDLESYPRQEDRDARLAEEAGVDLLFLPYAEDLYTPGHRTWVEVEELSEVLEGEFRPGHFRGVATICLKLFNLVRPHRAYFGLKDAQQVAVVRRMVADLDLDLEIRALPTVRDVDGLALSSRNVLLSPEERQEALVLPRALQAGASAHAAGDDPVEAARRVLDEHPGLKVDYVEVAEFEEGLPVLAAAVWVGSTRLIDNVDLRRGGSG